MKKLIEHVDGEGLESLLGENIWVWCVNYIYAGKLTGVSEKDIILADAKVVYSTGDLSADSFETAETVPTGTLYIRTSAIESYGVSGR